MANADISFSFQVDKAPHEVFEAIKNVRAWWNGQIEGQTANINDVFTYRYKDLHYSRHQLIEQVPDKRLVWLVTDSQLTFVKDQDEWNGTRIIFDISEKDGRTQVDFVHEGIGPHKECFEKCTGGWNQNANLNLYRLLTTGETVGTYKETSTQTATTKH